MKKILLFVVLMLVSVMGMAKDGLPPVYDVVKVKGEVNSNIPSEHWQVYEIHGDTVLSLKKATSKEYSGKFTYTTYRGKLEAASGLDFYTILENLTLKSKWVRFRLGNSSAVPKQVMISCNGGADKYYIYQNGKWGGFKSGSMYAPKDRDGDINENQIKLTLQPQEEVVVYINSYFSSSIPKISDYEVFISEKYSNAIVFDDEAVVGFGFAGFIAFALLFNLFFYYINREKLYLNYSMLLFFTAALSASDILIALWFPWASAFKIEIVVFLGAGFFISFINTFQLFLDISKYYPRWSIFLKYFTWFTCVFVFISILIVLDVKPDYEKNGYLLWVFFPSLIVGIFGFMASFVAFIILLVTTSIKLKRRKDPDAQIIFWSFVPYFASYPFVGEGVSLLFFMWGVVLLSWGMFARFKRLQEQYVQQALEKERITREKEEEKNALIAEQNTKLEQLVEERTAELEESLEHLKETQNQLIQSEKMASLGELTAGIAHEIQNPLNFVNNFSDVSVELLEEMEEELDKGDVEEVKAIAGDIKQNLEKIAHHGRRADSIVKGMLQHSRTSSGQKEPTDINALADEYLRLAYHGLRAKDKSFNAELITDFDSSLPKVEVLPQDFGRVLLNMFTNAFYATQQKVKQHSANSGQLADVAPYKPAVSVTTKLVDGAVEIKVKDNGTGIPDAIKDKILQPFFTTKPTGEGTGLGLSLSYDIVVKAHGGSIDIDSVEGEYTEFIIRIK
jgi:signal transduction histidine kinase